MYPILFNLSAFGLKIDVGAYRFFLILSAIVGVGLAWLIAKHRNIPSGRVLILLLSTVAAVPIGARLLHIATNYGWYAHQPRRWFSLKTTGFALFGGLLLAMLVGVIICRLLKLDLWRTADSVVPALGISMALMRIGCFMNGCCQGVSSTLPWAVTYPHNSILANKAGSLPLIGNVISQAVNKPVPTHPVVIYELIAALIGVIIAVSLIKRQVLSGAAFLSFFLWFSAFRLANHFLRVPSATFTGPSWFYPVFYLLTFLASAGFLLTLMIRKMTWSW